MSGINLCKQSDLVDAPAKSSAWTGLAISGAIATTWFITLLCSLSWDLAEYPPVAVGLWLLPRTFLHTGLFVIAHDAIHGNIFPTHPVENRWIGQLALGMYGFLPYRTCQKLHWQHHTHPAQTQDPDFYPKPDGHPVWYFVRWYCSFMGRYLTPCNLQFVASGICLTTLSLLFLFQVSLQNLVLFWLAPWILSSIQLFAFGIFLPHHSDDRSSGSHQPRSYYYPIICSLLTCYHFSYHREHDTYPHVPWYRLPYVEQPYL